MGFPLTPRSMTLDDLELLQGQILLEFCHISHISEAITDKRMKIDPYCQRRNCSPICTFQLYIDYVDIARHSSARGHQTTVRWQKQVFIHTRLSRAYLALARLSCNKMPYEQRLKALVLYSLQRRRLRGDLIETYKILTGNEMISSDQLFQKATTTELRGHSLELYNKSSRLELRKHFFSQRIVDHWNKLLEDVVSTATISTFIKRLGADCTNHT